MLAAAMLALLSYSSVSSLRARRLSLSTPVARLIMGQTVVTLTVVCKPLLFRTRQKRLKGSGLCNMANNSHQPPP